jgi:hypothetical protein
MLACFKEHYLFYVCLLSAVLLSAIPFVGKWINVLNTLIHESAHAVMSLLTGGGVMNIKLSADTSGAAQTKSKFWIGKVLTSMAGYPASSFTALLLFYLIQQQHVKYILFILLSVILINLILWVRNAFGMIWLLVTGFLLTMMIIYGTKTVQYACAVVCASVIFFQAVYSSITLLIISLKTPGKAGDAKNLSDFTYIPAAVWSIALLLLVGYVAYQTLNLF